MVTTISVSARDLARIRAAAFPRFNLMNDVDRDVMQKVRIQQLARSLSALEPSVHNDDPQVLEIREKDEVMVCTMTLSSCCARGSEGNARRRIWHYRAVRPQLFRCSASRPMTKARPLTKKIRGRR